ncbi:hypothetical protein [Hyalangium rubrum]|uniref:Lipoprotein n=1 Tax=Hyalangium rubrum TaxID=3103134 RepID=A0ABU5H696_9BACT|nr:hypothetical protein [Hyalangium sp. s54d21]MDY7227620.1 hypothetical protein [Hyalangium sp. s54d21]
MSSTFQRLPAAVLLALGLLVLPACDKGPEQLAKAQAQYADLVQRGVNPRDPAYDAVIAAFEAIPKDSKARAEADARLAALRALRGPMPPRPLATPGATGPGTGELEAQRAACEALAKELGTAPSERRETVRQALAECRARQVRLEADSHPPGEHGHDHETDAGR